MKKIYLLFGLDMLCTALFFTIFQRHGLHLGASYSFMGFIVSATAVLSILWKPLVGNLTDKIGSRTVLVSVSTLHAVAIIFTILAPNKWLFLLARMGCSVGNTTQTILRRVVVDLLGKNNSAVVFNKVGAVFSLAFIFGSLIGGQLAEFEDGLKFAYLLMFLTTVISVVIGLTLPNTDKTREDETSSAETQTSNKNMLHIFKNLKTIAVSDKYWDLFALKAAHDFGQAFVMANLRIVMLTVNGFSETQMSYITVFSMLCSMAASLSQTMLKDKCYPHDEGAQRIRHFTIMGTIVSILMALVPSTMVLTLQLHTVATITFECVLMEMLLRRIEEHEKGIVMSSYETIFNVVDVIVPPLSGLVADSIGVTVTLLACSLSYIVAYWLVEKKTRVKIE